MPGQDSSHTCHPTLEANLIIEGGNALLDGARVAFYFVSRKAGSPEGIANLLRAEFCELAADPSRVGDRNIVFDLLHAAVLLVVFQLKRSEYGQGPSPHLEGDRVRCPFTYEPGIFIVLEYAFRAGTDR